MMSHPTEVARIVTVGGKGTSLSSSAVYAVATGSATVRLDSSALDRLPNHAAAGSDPKLRKPEPPIPETLDPVSARASLVLLLSKLLPCRGVPASLPVVVADALNSGGGRLPVVDFGELAEDVCRVLETSGAELYGICALVDHESAALAAVVGAVASLSCEASKADMAAACSLTDTGDGLVNKEQALVASDLRVLLNGSKFVGKVKSDAFARIPAVIGKLREVVKSVHYNTRVELNSPAEGSRGIAGESICEVIHSLVFVLRRLGESSLLRSKMNLDAVGDDGLKSSLLVLFENNFEEGDLMSAGCKSAFDSYMENDYENFVHAVKCLLGDVWRIVTWEGISALFAIEGWELIGRKGDEGPDANGEDVKGDKKADKKKKKKAVLGKGTGQIVQWIKDKVQNKGSSVSDSSKFLEKWVEDLVLFFDPKDPGFDGFINKVKEVLESNESRRLPKLPKGTRDFAKEQMAIREKAFSIISGVFKRHGATALDTPVFEMRETLMGKYGEDSKLIYDLADQGGELCSLRYDLTVPFARYVAMNGITTLKRYQIAKVYRRDNPSKGRYREFYQCDFDIAGQFLRMGPDFEIIRILTELLDALDIGDYEVKLNHRKLLDGMLEICGVPAEKFRTICSSIDKLDKQSFEQVKKEMVEEKGLSIDVADRIGNFVKEKGSPKELLSKLKQEGSKFLENASSKFALEDLEILFEALDKSKCINKVVFDLSLARGLDYYTGVIFEAVFKGTTQVGSIAAGGRYDNLIGMFGTKQVPAVGVSLGIERVFAIMEQIQKEQNQTTRATETEVLLSILGNESKLPLAAEQVSALWDANLKAEYEISTRFSKHIDRARDSRIPWMVLVGDKELEKGVVKLKNLETTVEEEIPAGSLVEQLRSRLNR